MILILLAIAGVSRVSYILSFRYNSYSLSTVVETLRYPVHKVDFPAVTLCNFNPIDLDNINKSIEL